MHDRPTIRVYFNSACPVCRAGIESQKGRMRGCPVEWQDVHLDNELAKDVDADLEFVRERLHVIDENGRLRVGWDAFIAIWRNSPGEAWKARLASAPVAKPVLGGLYNLFARALYRWNRAKKHW
ncbi:DUF393 domain-containing protein [Microbulbifer magnicolonia]|uniref:thiol-disulfide oxidoreductase DCC family protein n=1 Tax=Microbulbifer magnicolonia TaxID=3109744 RepID=UPI002B415C84|nr:DUF393 domain-containing protein [Microbulbifer sp. GG15]